MRARGAVAQEARVVPFTDVGENFTGLRPQGDADLPGQRRIAQDMRELSSWVTPTEDFFNVSHYGYPELDASSYRLQFTGLVDSASSTVVAPVDGRLSSLLVTLHQEVEAGQVIARFDDRDVRLKLSQATYELERMRADVENLVRGMFDAARTFKTDAAKVLGIMQAIPQELMQPPNITIETSEERERVYGHLRDELSETPIPTTPAAGTTSTAALMPTRSTSTPLRP